MPTAPRPIAQSLSVQRAQVEFHSFASMGEPQRALAAYAQENERRGSLLAANLDFVGTLSPFLEIGANAGHTSYWLANQYEAEGIALDISADALRQGRQIKRAWNLDRSPLLIAGDAARLPFLDNSIPFIMLFQTLSQFQNLEVVIAEAARVLTPGGVLYFAEEPIRRKLTLNLYRAPYPDRMHRLESRLYKTGWLDFIVRDVIGAQQEESFGIRQNHRYSYARWEQLLREYFESVRLLTFPRLQGFANHHCCELIRRLFSGSADRRVADLLGATLAAFCKKSGPLPPPPKSVWSALACPACSKPVVLSEPDSLHCSDCAWSECAEADVFNLLPAALRAELYPPTSAADCLDFSRPGHEAGLISGFYELEGPVGNRYRWIGALASASLCNRRKASSRLRIRGFVPEQLFRIGRPRVCVTINNAHPTHIHPARPGLFVLECSAPSVENLRILIEAAPTLPEPGDPPDSARQLSVNISSIRLVPAGDSESAR